MSMQLRTKFLTSDTEGFFNVRYLVLTVNSQESKIYSFVNHFLYIVG